MKARKGNAGFCMMPAPPGTCPECAVDHAPEYPHDQGSLFYKYYFYSKHGRWPTWEDAMAHCSDEMKKVWSEALREKGAMK